MIATQTLNNLIAHKNIEQVAHLVNAGVIPPLCAFLQCDKEKVQFSPSPF